jgi:RNA polymerase sigma-70 factor, ECF subfamily
MTGLTDEIDDSRGAGAAAGRELAVFFEDHHPRLIRLAGLVSGDIAAAEDIVQTALERAWRSRAARHHEGSPRAWLDRIVVREAARERRWRLTWLARLARPPAVTRIDVPDREQSDPSAGRFPEHLALRQAFDGLRPPHRAVVVLHLHAGYTVDETARLLGIPSETVRSRLRVARDDLRHALEGSDR